MVIVSARVFGDRVPDGHARSACVVGFVGVALLLLPGDAGRRERDRRGPVLFAAAIVGHGLVPR